MGVPTGITTKVMYFSSNGIAWEVKKTLKDLAEILKHRSEPEHQTIGQNRFYYNGSMSSIVFICKLCPTMDRTEMLSLFFAPKTIRSNPKPFLCSPITC